MSPCSPIIDDPLRCYTKWELWRQIMALLPRGDAWQSNEDIFERYPDFSTGVGQDGAVFEAGASSIGIEPEPRRLTVMQRYWAAFAEVLEHTHGRICALIPEMFCGSIRETLPEWAAEYGFPDSCEPWDNICDKVRASGGASCAYLQSLAARLGYTITCIDCGPSLARADAMTADCTPVCECAPNVIRIQIPASQAAGYVPFAADAAVADCTPVCPTPPDAVVCLIERFKPAHVKAIYEVIT